jgi:hypothetical protein
MILADNKEHECDRYSEAVILLQSSTYDDEQRGLIADRLLRASPQEIDEVIENLLLNQIDGFDSGHIRLRDINKRLDLKGC